jgi:excisionase family DNA binding protein
MREEFLTVDEVVKMLRLNKNTLLKAIRAGQVPTVRVGRCLRIPAAWLRSLTAAGEPANMKADRVQ